MLKQCHSVHVGPKIEFHCHHAESSNSLNPDLKTIDSFLMYRERLKNRYATHNAYMRSLFWEGKRKDFSLRDYFVQLIMNETNLLGSKVKRSIRLEDLFRVDKTGHETVLLTGDPGYGKTTLCQKLAYDWATIVEYENYLKQFYFVVVVMLRHLNKKSLMDEVLHAIFQNRKEEFKTKLPQANLNILVILDGFDEISNRTSVLNFIREDSFEISLTMTILVTSRPHVTEEIREDAMYRFSLGGLSDEQKETYIRIVFQDDSDKSEDMVQVLNYNKFYSKLAQGPLMLHMLCCLHMNNALNVIQSETDLFVQIFSLFIKRYIKKNGENQKLKKGKYFTGEDLLIRLGELALNTIQHPITSKYLEEEFPEKEDQEFILGLEILFFDHFDEREDEISYDFVHRTFKEFLSALYLYDVLKSKMCICSISFQTTIFLFGLSDNDIFHSNLLEYVSRNLYTSYDMIRISKEIKNENNRKVICSKLKVTFYLDETDDIINLLKVLPFPRVYLILYPDYTDESCIEDLVKFHDNFDLYKLEIIIIMEQSNNLANYPVKFGEHFHFNNATIHFIDICAFANCLIHLFTRREWKNFKIYFSGRKFGDIDFFINIEKDVVTRELQNNIKETSVALQVNYYNNIYNYVISEEQFKILQPYIKTFSNLE
ncbi:uncharacterized protein LOC111620145 isoform X2 [Centruroides sculpturatus]|nr:uncharacterized protein LOC111620145 isoform X2 [Centruroides sculpturatus]